MSNLKYFMGVVEDRRDPLKYGRVRVRVFGVHSEDKLEIPTEDLPWAIPIVGTYSNEFKPPMEGSWVFGFFLDGDEAQHPLLLGALPGMPTSFPDVSNAFSGTDIFPKPNDILQPDMPRLARAENIEETSVARKFINREVECEAGFNEPTPPYNTQYPYNRVMETESGHVVEYDDTPGAERINIEHSTGSFIEMGPTGNRVEKIMQDNFRVVRNNDSLYVKGAGKITIDGDFDVTIKSALNLIVDGDMNTTVHGDYNLKVGGEISINAVSATKIQSSAVRIDASLDSVNVFAKKNIISQADGNIVQHANTGTVGIYARQNITIESGGDHYQYTAGETNFRSIGEYTIDTDTINFNTDDEITDDPVRDTRPFGARPALRALLGEPPARKFTVPLVIETQETEVFTDLPEENLDTHEFA